LRLGIPMTIKMEREAIALKTFYNKMNETAKKLGLKNSNWSVCHGMHHSENVSSAYDVALLARHCLSSHGTLREIVNTKKYSTPSYIDKDHIYKWENTNYMLWDKSKCYYGIKTGITPTAGPCLSVHYKSRDGRFDFILVILNSQTREARFTEIPKLVEWA
jgi:D-alanyl-D-alanine carboxypeptidase